MERGGKPFGQITIERAGPDGVAPFGNSPLDFSTSTAGRRMASQVLIPPAIPTTRKVVLGPAAHQGFLSSWKSKTPASDNLPHHTHPSHQRNVETTHRRHLHQSTTRREYRLDAEAQMQRTRTTTTMSSATATSGSNRPVNHTDDDAYVSSPGDRDSHDLTFTSNNPMARESLVENMLLSLDRLGTSDFGFSQDPSVNQFFPTHDEVDVEYIDDDDDYYDEPEGHHQHHHNRQQHPHRHHHQHPQSAAEALHESSNRINTSHNYHRQQQQSHPQRTLNVAPQRGFPNRDKSLPSTPSQQSFVDGYAQDEHPVLNRPDTSNQGRSFPGGAYSVDIYSDAAPTPTISNRSRDRAPPSRNQPTHPFSPASPLVAPLPPLPPAPPPPPPPTRLERKRSNTTRSYKREKAVIPSNEVMDDTVVTSHPTDSSNSAPAPSVPQITTKGAGTQKTGFFRRVFGSSNKTSASQNAAGADNPAPPTSPPESVQVQAQAAPVKSPPSTAVADAPSVPSSRPTVTKKASGFFRRRKRSVNENDLNAMPNASVVTPSPFHNIASRQFDSTEHPILPSPGPPPPHILQGSIDHTRPPTRPPTSVESAMGKQPQDYTKRVGTPTKQVSSGFVANQVTTSPSNKHPDRADMKPTIMTVETQNIGSVSSATVGKEVGKEAAGTVGTNNSTAELGASSTPAISMKEAKTPNVEANQGERPETSGPSLPVTPKKEADTGVDATIKNQRPPPPSRTPTGNSNITMGSLDVPDEAKSARGLKLPEDDDASQRTPTRNNSMPVVVLNDAADASGEANGDQEATPQPKRVPEVDVDTVGEPSEEEKEKAKKIFEGDEEFVSKARAAAWLGENGETSERIRKAYMALFDFSNINHLAAMRALCEKLVLKGETQQVERLLDSLAKRWVDCNQNHGFKCLDVVKTIMYSLLLLNTDLHLADIPHAQKMTRSQFIRNTMTTIRKVMVEADLTSAFPGQNPGQMRSQTPGLEDREDTALSPNKAKVTEGRSSLDQPRSNRLSFIRGAAVIAPRFFDELSLDVLNLVPGADGSASEKAFVSAPFNGSSRQWETIIEEHVLKGFYASVRLNALPLHGMSSDRNIDASSNSSSLMVGGSLRRTPSTVSKAPSEMSLRTPGDRYGNVVTSARSETTPKFGSGKWGLKNRSRPRLYPSSFAGSSRTSFEDRMWSPSASSTWSKYSLDKTTPSLMSVDSLGAGFGHKDYQQSIGFANALSHAIIREEAASGSAVSLDGVESVQNVLIDDDLETLALHGAPWAKEGLVKHKHHLESVGKKAKNRGWTECFAVVEKGCMRLFLFPSSDKKRQQQKSGLVGGGNWLENAESIGSFVLRQSIASALPPPGYSKSRPHVLALSLPTGAVHLFQVGTADIVKEWVTTANYWSARLSKEPLIGGVSNMEYGWGNCLDPALIQSSTTASSSSSRPPTAMSSRPSFQESIRSSMDHGIGVRSRLPGDKVTISEWSPPSQSMVASTVGEKDQLRALDAYVKSVESELQKHNELRSAMVVAFTQRHINYSKAMNNWERKSSYLLREIVKFRTYIDALAMAIEMREKILSEQDTDNRSADLPDVSNSESNNMEIAAES